MTVLARHRLVLLLIVVVTLGLLIVPFALRGDDARPPPPRDDPAPSEASEPPTEVVDMTVLDSQRADVDGDGLPDEVRLMKGPAPGEREPADGMVDVALAQGGTVTAEVPFGYFDTLQPAFDINGDGREQVLLHHTQGGDSMQLLVYAMHDGELVALHAPRLVPLGTSVPDSARGSDYYVQDGRLRSWLRTDPFDPAQRVYRVETWSWSVDGDRLVATATGTGCVDLTSAEPPHPCP